MMNVSHRRSIRLLKRIAKGKENNYERSLKKEQKWKKKKKKKKEQREILQIDSIPYLYLLSTTIDIELGAHV